MFSQQNYFNRSDFKMSKFQNQGQSYGMHQHSYGYNMNQRDFHSYGMHQRGSPNYGMQHRSPQGYPEQQRSYGNFAYQQNHGYHPNHQRHYGSIMQEEYYGNSKPPPHFRGYNSAPGGFCFANNMQHARNNYNGVHSYDKHYYNGGPGRQVRPIRSAVTEESLYPHGEPSAQDWIDTWDQRPECPRTKWTHTEKLESKITSVSKEYSGTDLIEETNQAELKTCSDGLTNFYEHLRPQLWQLISPMDPDSKIIAKNISEDFGRSDSSEYSSVDTESSVVSDSSSD